MLNRIALAVLLWAPCAALAQQGAPPLEPLEESATPTIGYDTVAEALAALRRDPAARVLWDGDWTIIEVGKIGTRGFALWHFSPPSHPAHPTAIKRSFDVREGQVVINMDVACEAPTPACEAVVREFQAATVNYQRSLNAERDSR